MYWNVIYYVSLCHFIGGNILVVFGIDPGYAIVGWGAISFQSNTYRAIGAKVADAFSCGLSLR